MKNLKKMYEAIAQEMQIMTKTKISAANCENKWKVLERNYKKYVENLNKIGRGRKIFEYADLMDGILGKKKNIHPVILLSSENVCNPMEYNERLPEEIEPSNSIIAEEEASVAKNTQTNLTPKPTAYQNKRVKSSILKEIRNDRKEYYRQRLEIEEKKLQEQIRQNNLLQERNKFLEKYVGHGGVIIQEYCE